MEKRDVVHCSNIFEYNNTLKIYREDYNNESGKDTKKDGWM